MSVRPDHCHHRPYVRRLPGDCRCSGFAHWFALCACGLCATFTTWHDALVAALSHSGVQR